LVARQLQFRYIFFLNVFPYYRIYRRFSALAWVKLFTRFDEDRESNVYLLHIRFVFWMGAGNDIEESKIN